MDLSEKTDKEIVQIAFQLYLHDTEFATKVDGVILKVEGFAAASGAWSADEKAAAVLSAATMLLLLEEANKDGQS